MLENRHTQDLLQNAKLQPSKWFLTQECFGVERLKAPCNMLCLNLHEGRVASWLFSQKFCFSQLLNKLLFFSFNHPDNVCFGTPYFFDMDADNSPFSTSFSILFASYSSGFEFSFTTSKLRHFRLQNKTRNFRQLYLFNFRTFEVSNHTNLNWKSPS